MRNTRNNEHSCLTGSKRSTKTKNWQNKTSQTPTTLSSSTTRCTKMHSSQRPTNQSSLLLLTQRSAKTRQTDFCWHRRSCARIRYLEIFIKSRAVNKIVQNFFRFPHFRSKRIFRFFFFSILHFRRQLVPRPGREPEPLMDTSLVCQSQSISVFQFFHIFNITCTPSFQKSTTAHKATGKASSPSQSSQPRQRSLKVTQKYVLHAKPFGKFISLRQNTFLAPNLMCPPQTQFTRQAFFFFHTILWGVAGAEKHTNTLWPWLMWPAVSKRLNPWPRKNWLRLQALFKTFTNAGLWNGDSFCKWTWDESSWALSPRRRKNTKHTFGGVGVGGWVFTGTRPSWKDSTAPLLNLVWPSICCWDAASWGAKIFQMGRSASCCGLCPERRSRSFDWQEAGWSHQRKGGLFQTLYSLFGNLLEIFYKEGVPTVNAHQQGWVLFFFPYPLWGKMSPQSEYPLLRHLVDHQVLSEMTGHQGEVLQRHLFIWNVMCGKEVLRQLSGAPQVVL